MKKLIVAMIVSAFMMAPVLSMAQDAKPAEKAKKECCKSDKKECTSDQQKACKKENNKACCSKQKVVEKK